MVAALRASGYDVREVQASRTNDRRRRRHRAKTDITDAHAIAAETLADPALPPARKHLETPSPAWDTLRVLRSQRESLVLQRVRLLTEAEPVLCALPVEIRDQLPATSSVMSINVNTFTLRFMVSLSMALREPRILAGTVPEVVEFVPLRA